MQKAIGPVKSNHQIDSESQAFLPNQSENRLQPNCEGFENFAMSFFDKQAMQDYIQILHGLIKRLSENSKKFENVNLEDDLRICRNIGKVGKYETKSVNSGKGLNSLTRNVPRMNGNDEKENLEMKRSKSKELDKKRCTFCNLLHAKGKEKCKAYNRVCYKCKQFNHFSVVCRTKKPKRRVEQESGKTVETFRGSRHKIVNVEDSIWENSNAKLRKDSETLMEECKTENSDAEIPQENPAVLKSKVRETDEKLKWINKKLRTNHCAFVELKDGKGLHKLIGKVLGYAYSGRSPMPWKEIEDVLLMEDMETHFPLVELKGGNEDAMMKFIKWLQDEEIKRRL